MKILVLMTHNCPWNNSIATSLRDQGHEVFVFDFVDGTRSNGLEHEAMAVKDSEDYKKRYQGMFLVETDRGMSKYLLYAHRLRTIAQSVQADLVFALYSGGYGMLTYLSGVRPYALYAVGSDILLAGPLRRSINRRVLGAAGVVFSNGQYLTDQARLQAPQADIRPLLIGIDLGKLKICDFSRRPIQIVCNRGFDTVYNNESIIKALALLPKSVPEFRMVFVSAGPRLRDAIALADAVLPAHLRARVEFLGGTNYANVLEIVGQSHVFVSMSRSDGTSTAVLEAMGSGLFPVLSDIAQNRALIDPVRKNGALVPLDDDQALAETLRSALCDIDSCAAHAEFNRLFIADIADSKRNMAKMARELELIAGSRR